MSGTHDCGGDAAAYVLGALEPDEAEALPRATWTGASSAATSVASFQQVADALPMSAPQYPVPARLRRRVLTEVRADARRQRRGRARASARRAGAWLPRPALAGGLAACRRAGCRRS